MICQMRKFYLFLSNGVDFIRLLRPRRRDSKQTEDQTWPGYWVSSQTVDNDSIYKELSIVNVALTWFPWLQIGYWVCISFRFAADSLLEDPTTYRLFRWFRIAEVIIRIQHLKKLPLHESCSRVKAWFFITTPGAGYPMLWQGAYSGGHPRYF